MIKTIKSFSLAKDHETNFDLKKKGSSSQKFLQRNKIRTTDSFKQLQLLLLVLLFNDRHLVYFLLLISGLDRYNKLPKLANKSTI